MGNEASVVWRAYLPTEFVQLMVTMRISKDRRLDGALGTAYELGWSSVLLGTAIEVTPAAVRQRITRWRRNGRPDPGMPVPAPVQPSPTNHLIVAAIRAARHGMTGADRLILAELAPLAREVRGRMSADHPARQASQRLTAFINQLVQDRGVSLAEIGQAVGMTSVGVVFRLARHGYRTGPPSFVRSYRGDRSAPGA